MADDAKRPTRTDAKSVDFHPSAVCRIFEQGPRFRLRVHGPDAVDLLHRVTSNDVRGLAPGERNHQCLLTPKGKIVSLFALERLPDGAMLEGPIALKETTRAALDRYVIMEQVTVEALPDDEGVPVDENERIRAGWACWGADIDEETIPFEAGMDAWVSTSKGCYTGQETIARIETYGGVARRLLRLVSADPAPAATGDLVLDGAVVGRLTSVTASADASGVRRAIAMVRKAGWPAGVRMTGPGGALWTGAD